MRGYDEWLEKPYDEAAADTAAYERWCEANDLDPADDHLDDFIEAMENEREG